MIAVSSSAQSVDAAWEFIEWTLSDDVQLEIYAKNGAFTSRTDLADNVYAAADPRLVVNNQALINSQTPRTLGYNEIFNDKNGPWIAAIQSGILDGDVAGPLPAGNDGILSILDGYYRYLRGPGGRPDRTPARPDDREPRGGTSASGSCPGTLARRATDRPPAVGGTLTVSARSRPGPAREPRRSPWARKRALMGLAFVSPALIIVSVFFLIPLLGAFYISLTEWNVAGFKKFVGLENYIDLLTDKRWHAALQFTTFYTVVVTIVTFMMGFGLALMVRMKQRRFVILRTAFYLPVVIGVATASFIFLYLFNDQIGAVNAALRGLGIIDEDIAWLANPGTAFLTLLVLTVWKNAGFAMITLLIAMQAVPEELYEAARVDGASSRQMLRRITVPLILPTIALVVLLLVVGSYLAFDQFYIITRGGPNNSTITATYWIYNQAFVAFKFGYSTAMSVVLMVFLVVLGAIQLRILRRDVTAS